MKKKGVVYRATMLAGIFIVMLQAAGETAYGEFKKNQRNEEIEKEKKAQSMEEGEEDGGINPLSKRDRYK